MAASGNKRISITGTAAFPVATGSEDVIASIVFEVSAADSLSMLPKASLNGSGTTPANIAYVNLLTGAAVAAGTAITANGIYGVFAPNCYVTLTASAGSCTVDWDVVLGRVA